MKSYDHKRIERKWQARWKKSKLYKTADTVKGKKNYYLLTEFPYPSGNLHVGHWYAFSVPDILARALRMQGKNVMYPFGFDAFGLPAENAAIKNKLNPRKWTLGNIKYMKKQITSMGASFDWSRELATCDPEYYKWTQWQFLQFFKAGLAYRKETAVNWCPSCKTVLANEQVVDGKCERCGTEVIQKQMLQWNLKITDYADRLIDDLSTLDWPEQIKESQKNWIGRSEGAEIDFRLTGNVGDDSRYLILHGREGKPTSVFIPWLKEELEKAGHEVEVPQLPNTNEPNAYEQAEYILKNCTVDEKTVVIGHSIGGVTALRLLEKGAKVRRVILVATPYSGRFLDGKKRPSVTDSVKKGFDFETIRNNTKSIIVMPDVKDDRVPFSDAESYAQKLAGMLVHGRGEEKHFMGKIEPDVLMCLCPTIRVFTTRADTLFGATYMVLSPEHPWVRLAIDDDHKVLENKDEVKEYVTAANKKTELERLTEQKEKTGVRLKGVEGVNPATGEKIPIFVADYVLAHYGTGAIMAVPAHDERDFAFAKKFELPIRDVISTGKMESGVFAGEGVLVNSGAFNGLKSIEAKSTLTDKFGRSKITYKLRDWIVSRQRYWGVPIPIVHCERCGDVAIPDPQLPVTLPEIKDYLPTGDGKSPLAKAKKWVKVKCPQCKGTAERETDTLDTFVDSSWYFLRYADTINKKKFADMKKMDAWMPVDLYSGGAEHTTMHLLYSRFWQKALYDLKLVKDSEPYTRRMNRSIILGPDGQKMSKSRGNVIDPDAVVAKLGADTVRMYLAFIGPYNEVSNYPWNPDGVVGIRRFLERVWRLRDRLTISVKKSDGHTISNIERMLHVTIKKVGDDITALKFNTAIAQMMSFMNEAESKGITKAQYETLLRLLAPFAPHIADELWSMMGHKKSVHIEKWPAFDPHKLASSSFTIAVQVNGKTRTQITIPAAVKEDAVKEQAETAAGKWLEGKAIKKIIYVPGRIVNIVAGE
ncbi:MAG: leucyl-tRNA synthetase [Parcubacteria group bacterium Gr01-1014_8]|nr:MAG: leucyl-tRNA synthetase [Parcubacteria group bacterium Gr01-1014_8]